MWGKNIYINICEVKEGLIFINTLGDELYICFKKYVQKSARLTMIPTYVRLYVKYMLKIDIQKMELQKTGNFWRRMHVKKSPDIVKYTEIRPKFYKIQAKK